MAKNNNYENLCFILHVSLGFRAPNSPEFSFLKFLPSSQPFLGSHPGFHIFFFTMTFFRTTHRGVHHLEIILKISLIIT